MSTYQEKSYTAHQEHFKQDLVDPQRLKIGESWFREDTANYWVHIRMFEGATHLLTDPQKTWVTIGDGRYGLDSIILRRKGWQRVLPTDISDILLKSAAEKGLITEYGSENAEALSFPENHFDYVFCKESYHHFPRPMIALYEMLRVAKEGVLLIEPHDTVNSPSLHGKLRRLKRSIKKQIAIAKIRCLHLWNKEKMQLECINLVKKQHIDAGRYEDSTNYIYAVTTREMEKVALGLNYPIVAFKGINDSYEPGCEFEFASFKNKTYRRMRIRCWINTFLCKLGIKDYSMLMSLLFKNDPSEIILSRLKKHGWEVVYLPRNPYC